MRNWDGSEIVMTPRPARFLCWVMVCSCLAGLVYWQPGDSHAQAIPDTGGGPVGADDLSSCRVAKDVDATFDDEPLPASMGQTLMIASAFCRCRGTCSTPPVIQLHYEEAGTGGPADNVIGSMTCQLTTDSPALTAMSATVPALDELLIDVTNAPAGADTVTICIVYSTS